MSLYKRLVRPSLIILSVVRSPFSKISSEITWSIETKFYMEPKWDGEVYINDPGHMTKMATISIYGTNLKSLQPEGL